VPPRQAPGRRGTSERLRWARRSPEKKEGEDAMDELELITSAAVDSDNGDDDESFAHGN
jgi:hypothetical protein